MADLQHVAGLQAYQRALAALPGRIAKNVLTGAVGAGAAELRKEAKLRAPVATKVGKNSPPPGTLKRAIFSGKSRSQSNGHRVAFRVSVKQARNGSVGNKGVQAYGNKDAFYWRWVEFGTSKMAAHPFLRPAFESKKLTALDDIRAYLAKRIPEEIAKLRR